MYFHLINGTLLLILALILTPRISHYGLQLMRRLIRKNALCDWIDENESVLTSAIWAVVIVSTYFIGPRIIMLVVQGAHS